MNLSFPAKSQKGMAGAMKKRKRRWYVWLGSPMRARYNAFI